MSQRWFPKVFFSFRAQRGAYKGVIPDDFRDRVTNKMYNISVKLRQRLELDTKESSGVGCEVSISNVL
jgi:hypothetical protein